GTIAGCWILCRRCATLEIRSWWSNMTKRQFDALITWWIWDRGRERTGECSWRWAHRKQLRPTRNRSPDSISAARRKFRCPQNDDHQTERQSQSAARIITI